METNQEKINRLIMAKLSLDDDFERSLISYTEYNKLCDEIDSAIRSLS